MKVFIIALMQSDLFAIESIKIPNYKLN